MGRSIGGGCDPLKDITELERVKFVMKGGWFTKTKYIDLVVVSPVESFRLE